MSLLLILSLLGWTFSLAYMAWQVWIAPEMDEDAHLPRPAKSDVAAWHRMRIRHPRHSRRYVTAEH